MYKTVVFIAICLLILSSDTITFCQEKTFILKNEKRKHSDSDLLKQFDLNDIDWDNFRQLDKRTYIQLFNASASIEVLSVKELEEDRVPVDRLKIEKMELAGRSSQIDLNSNLILKCDEYGNTYMNESKRKVSKRH